MVTRLSVCVLLYIMSDVLVLHQNVPIKFMARSIGVQFIFPQCNISSVNKTKKLSIRYIIRIPIIYRYQVPNYSNSISVFL